MKRLARTSVLLGLGLLLTASESVFAQNNSQSIPVLGNMVSGFLERAKEKRSISQISEPSFTLGNPKPSHRVTFIWSSQCSSCRSVFNSVDPSNGLFNAYWRAVSKKDIAFTFLEYEDTPSQIAMAASAMCRGKTFYGFWAIGNLLTGITPDRAAQNPKISKRVGSYCDDPKVGPKLAADAFLALRKMEPTITHNSPVIILDGRAVGKLSDIYQVIGQ